MFHTPKPRKFNYTPRYYDPAQEAFEKKKAARGLDSKLSEREKLRMKIRSGYGYDLEEENNQSRRAGFNAMRSVIFLALMGFLVYVIFETPILENFFEMFLKLGK